MRMKKCCLNPATLLGICCLMLNGTLVHAQEVEQALQWNMITAKETYAPGEPVLLNIHIKNGSDQDGEVLFGSDGLGAFSLAIRNEGEEVVQQGGKIERTGLTRTGFLKIPAKQSRIKQIVLNQWCSTLLPRGEYTVICSIQPFYVPQNKPMEVSPPVAQPLSAIELKCPLVLIESDAAAKRKTLEDLANKAFQGVTNREGIQKREIAREMIAFSEFPSAVPYQLRILQVSQSTWLKRDVIRQLAKSKTLEAAKGLVRYVETAGEEQTRDAKEEIGKAIHRLRETRDAGIISCTNEFAAKHPSSAYQIDSVE